MLLASDCRILEFLEVSSAGSIEFIPGLLFAISLVVSGSLFIVLVYSCFLISSEPTKYLYIISKSTDPIPLTGSHPTETLSPSAQHLELRMYALSDEVMSLINDAFLLWLEYSAGLRKPRGEAPAFCLAMFIRDTISLNR